MSSTVRAPGWAPAGRAASPGGLTARPTVWLPHRRSRAAAPVVARQGAPPPSGVGQQGGAARQPQDPAPSSAAAATQPLRGNCYGCGVQLQLGDPEVAGYVEPERYQLKLRHRQLDQLLCLRCQDLSNGAMIPAVADFAQQRQAAAAAAAPAAGSGFEGKLLLTPEQLRERLKVVQSQRAVVVLLVDLLDVNGSMLARVRELVGNNPIMLVGTKVDLLPAGTDLDAVADWLLGAAAARRVAAVSAHLVSARTGDGMSEAVAAMRKERRGRDVYVMGAANVGKSAFIRALVKDMSSAKSRQYDPLAASRVRYLPVESAMPGTTLQLIPMEVFSAGGLLYDTPGVHLHHRVPHLLSPEENRVLHPRKRLRGYVAPSPSEVAAAAAGQSGSGAPVTYHWGGLVRLEVLECPEATQLVFYGPQVLRVSATLGDASSSSSSGGLAAQQQEEQQEGEAGGAAAQGEQGPFGVASVEARGGLRVAKEFTLSPGSSSRRPVADIAVSGVPGWVTVYAGGGGSGGARGRPVRLRVWAPVGVEAFSRPPLPVPPPFEPGPAAGAGAEGFW